MNCFYHPDRTAVGLCKHCSKALCPDCAADLEHGLACVNKHEEEVENLNMLISKNTKVQTAAPKNSLIAPIFYLFLGLVFAGFGLFSNGGMTDLPFIMGAGFIVFAVVVFIQNRKIYRKNA
jgi:hypothetical protein